MAKVEFSFNTALALKARDVIKDAVSKNALDLKSESSKQAPKKYGDLEDNCNISSWQHDGSGDYLTVGYDLPYARRQHEGYFKHPLKGKRKFLEDPFNDNQKRYFANVVKRLKEFFKG